MIKKPFRSALIAFLILICILIIAFNLRHDIQDKPFSENRELQQDTIQRNTLQCRPTARSVDQGVLGIGVAHPSKEGIAARIANLGARWVRTDILWWMVAKEDGTYDWSLYDSFISQMQEQDVQLALMLNHKPHWLSDWDDVHEQYRDFVYTAVNRYKPGGMLAQERGWKEYGVSYWEIFNEPNLSGFGWLHESDDPRSFINEYALALANANIAIREADSNAVIILGGLSPWGPDGQFIEYQAFINDLYKYENIKNCYDIFAFHPYGKIGKFAKMIHDIDTTLSNVDDEKPIWFNEHGTDIDKERLHLLQQVATEYEIPDGYFWFSLDDLHRRGGNFGLLEYDLEPKDEYAVFKELFINSDSRQ